MITKFVKLGRKVILCISALLVTFALTFSGVFAPAPEAIKASYMGEFITNGNRYIIFRVPNQMPLNFRKLPFLSETYHESGNLLTVQEGNVSKTSLVPEIVHIDETQSDYWFKPTNTTGQFWFYSERQIYRTWRGHNLYKLYDAVLKSDLIPLQPQFERFLMADSSHSNAIAKKITSRKSSADTPPK